MPENNVQTIEIVKLSSIHFKDWLRLWKLYQSFYQTSIADHISINTWNKLSDEERTNVYGFAAIYENEVVGIVHIIEHESCWTLEPYAYLQDLFVDEQYRGRGIARLLIEHVYQVTRQKGCDRVYWLTHESNRQARQLYDRIARQTGFIQYRSH